MQVRTWVHGGSTRFITDDLTGNLPQKLPKQASRAEFEGLVQTLSTEFDLVYDVDDFDNALAEVGRRLGLPANASALQYERVSPRPETYGGGLVGEARANARAAACPNMTVCRELVNRIAPFDVILHARARNISRILFSSSLAHAQAQAQLRPPAAPLERSATASGRSQRYAPTWVLSPTRNCRGANTISAVEAAAAVFGGTCARTTSIDSLYDAADDAPPAVRSLHRSSSRDQRARDVQRDTCELFGDAAQYRDAADATCDEVRAVFYFAPPPPPGVPLRHVALPQIPPSACNVAFVDNTTRFSKDDRGDDQVVAGGWRLRRLRRWPFAKDGPRTAHYLKVVAPLLFPNARVVLAGDIKCAGMGGGFPCGLMRPEANVDLHVAKNRWWRSRTVEGEFVSTWRHMRLRKMGASTFRQISAQLKAYEQSGDDMEALYRMPDTFCMAWHAQRPASRAFACRLGYEVATRSMREQLSFDHARPPELKVSWWSMRIVGQYGNEQCVNTTSPNRSSELPTKAQRSARGSSPHSASITVVNSHPASTISSFPLHLPLRRVLTGSAIETSDIGSGWAQSAPAKLHHALCVTGLTRSFGEIGPSVRSRVLRFLQSMAAASQIDVFGVQPRNDTWAPVFQHLGPFASVEGQEPCRPAGAPLPAFFTCTRGRAVHRLDSCTVSFVQMQCDLSHCDAMIRRHESAVVAKDKSAFEYDYVTWMRLDVVWEVDLAAALPVPVAASVAPSSGSARRHDVVWLPQMNSQQAGLCDKFAFGTRRAMHLCEMWWRTNMRRGRPLSRLAVHLITLSLAIILGVATLDVFCCGRSILFSQDLNRIDRIDDDFSVVPRNRQGLAAAWNCTTFGKKQVCHPKPFHDTSKDCTKRAGCMLSMSSERFLSYSLYRANLTVVRMKWAFCKFGNSTHAWHGCTARLRAGRPRCTSLNCPAWMAGGCTCQTSTTCSAKDWYCIDVTGGNAGLEAEKSTGTEKSTGGTVPVLYK
jgi:hypothetical protein